MMPAHLGAAGSRAVLTLLPAMLFACGGPERTVPPETPTEDVAASWTNGHVSFADLEAAVAEARTPACVAARGSGGAADTLLPCYREAAESIALEKLVLAEIPDLDRALAGLGERYQELRRHAYLEDHLRRLRDSLEISEEAMVAYFEEHPERFRDTGRLTLWNLFRRHRDGAEPEEAIAFLSELKDRFEAGETFERLAREHSHSETRLRGGLVGQLSGSRLPERLRKIAFALAPGEVSEPVRVRGGAVLLHVTEVVDAAEVTFADVRRRVRRQLEAERMQEAIAARVAGRQPPEGALVLTLEELIAALDADDGDRVVLEITEPLTADQMRRVAGYNISQRFSNLDEAARERLARLYRQQQQNQLLVVELLENAPPEMREVAEEHLREEAVDALVDETIRTEIGRIVDGDPERLRRYFDDNRLHYQSPLRFQLHVWTLPFGDDPPAQLRQMETMHRRLAAGEITLAAAAGELGGSVNSIGWTDFEQLRRLLPGKAQSFLLQLGAGGYTIPYQQAEALHVVWLEERREPRQLDYEEAAEQVRDDYVTRFGQELYREVAEARFDAAGYVFREEAVRRLLAF